jgi:hypothetical protein
MYFDGEALTRRNWNDRGVDVRLRGRGVRFRVLGCAT